MRNRGEYNQQQTAIVAIQTPVTTAKSNPKQAKSKPKAKAKSKPKAKAESKPKADMLLS